MRNIQKTFAFILGIILLIIGLLGFIDNPLIGNKGLFSTNASLNMVYILAGVFGIYIGFRKIGQGYTATVGWVGIVLGIIGFIPQIEGLFEDIFNMNTETSILHLIIGLICLGVYYGLDSGK